MLYIIGYLLCVLLIFKGIEIYQLRDLATNNARESKALLLGYTSLIAAFIISAFFGTWITLQKANYSKNISGSEYAESSYQTTKEPKQHKEDQSLDIENRKLWDDSSKIITQGNIQKPTIVYISAEWALPARKMEETTFNDSEVIRMVSDLHTINTIKIDITNQPPKEIKNWLSQHQVEGVPTFIFLKSNGEEIKKLKNSGYLKTAEFINCIKKLKKLANKT